LKLKEITRLSIQELVDDELAKLHSQIHGMDKSQDEDRKKRERTIWEAHNIVAAELITRKQKHTSPLGNEDGNSPASSETNKDDLESDKGTEAIETDSETGKEGLDGASDKTKADTYECECLDCGHEFTSTDHCADTPCPDCGGETRRADRPGAGKEARRSKGVKIKMGKVYFLLSQMNKALQDKFGDYAYYCEIDVDGPAVIADVWKDSTEEWVSYRIPFTLAADGIILDVENMVEVEAQVVYTTKSVTITAPVVKESMDDEKQYALYVVYVPEVDDSQGERMTKEDIEKACWSFGKKCYFAQGNRIDMQHAEDMEKHSECMVVENFVSREDGYMGNPEGTWYMGIIHGDEEWEMLKNGDINGVSMAGQAAKEEREVEDED